MIGTIAMIGTVTPAVALSSNELYGLRRTYIKTFHTSQACLLASPYDMRCLEIKKGRFTHLAFVHTRTSSLRNLLFCLRTACVVVIPPNFVLGYCVMKHIHWFEM